jgi:ABC-type multidrug transport system fused ATPase/permease subunit
VIERIRELWALVRGEDERGRKVRWLLGLLRPYRRKVALMFLALIAATAAGLAPPYLVGRAIDDGITAGDQTALYVIVGLFVASALFYWAATYAQTYLVGWVGQRALQDLRQRIFAHLQAMSIGFFTRNRPGVLISRLTNDVQALDSLVTDGIVTLFSSTLTLVGVVVILLLLDVPLALVTFVTFPLLAVGSVIFRIVAADAYRRTRETIAGITAHLQETLSGVRVVRSFGQERRHVSQMDELNEENRLANMKTVYLNASGRRRSCSTGDTARLRGTCRSASSSHSSATCRRSSTRSSRSRSSTRPISRGWRRSTRSSSFSTPSRT